MQAILGHEFHFFVVVVARTAIKCQPLKSVQNGVIIPESCTTSNKIYFGTKCFVRCKEGFTREGPEKRICSGHTGTWSRRHSVTQCIGKR